MLCLDAGNPKSYPGSGTIWTNLSGSSYNGVLVNGVGYSSDNLGSLSFDGVDDYVFITTDIFFADYSQQITMETWVYIPSSATWSNGLYGGIFTRGDFAGSYGLWRTATDNQVSAYFRQTGTFAITQSIGTIGRDQWYQLVAIWTGSGSQLYINGDLVDSDAGSLGTTTSANQFRIGGGLAAQTANGNFYTGFQSSSRVYNRALTASEVQQNFNATRSRYGI